LHVRNIANLQLVRMLTRRKELSVRAALGAGRAAQGFRSALVIGQIAVSVGLLVAAGMLAKSFYNLQSEGAGFTTENVWTARVALPEARYATPEAEARFYDRAIEALAAMPGVSRVGFTSALPFSGFNPEASFGIEGYTPRDGEPPPHAQMRSINDGYLPALDIPVIRGRNFTAMEAEPVAIVDENLAEKYWPDGDVLGQRLVHDRLYTIIGVIRAVKHQSLADPATKETIFWHYQQQPPAAGMFALRSTLPIDQLTRLATDTIDELDPDVPLFNVMSLDARVSASLGPARAPVVLTLLFAAGAFILAVVGIYGVLTWVVTQRGGEIGVRIALGAGTADIVRMILRQGGRLTLIGLCCGTALAVLLGQVLAAQVYEVSAVDPEVFAAVILGLGLAALFASWLPARRAARTDPMAALREE
jgi:putative ABC transport system permease protein